VYYKKGGSSLKFSFPFPFLSEIKPQFANVSLHCADVSLQCTDVSLPCTNVSLQCKNINISYINDKEHIKNKINKNYIIKPKFIFIKVIFHKSHII